MTNWQTTKASDFCLSVRDGTHDSPKRVNNGKYLITSRHIIGKKIDLTKAYQISNSDYDEVNRRSKVDRWDVLFSMIGTVGEVCLVKDEPNFAIKNIGLFKSKNELFGKWLYYFLQSKKVKQVLNSLKRGTTQEYIPLGDLRNLNISYPTNILETQKIISILSALDDKIENNRKMNETLETVAQVLFKSWFVDFDPVHAKATGKTPAYMDAETAALFPSSFGDDGLPVGWNFGTYSDAMSIYDSKRIPLSKSQRERKQGVFPYYGATSCMDYVDEYLFDGVYLLMGEDGSVIREDGTPFLQYVWGKFWVNNHAHVLQGANGFSTEHLFCALSSVNVAPYVTGAVQLKINQANMKRIPIVVPTKQILSAFSETVQPFFDKRRLNIEENQTLAELRDTLLPKLMSGEIRVKDAEREVERAI